MNLHSIYLSDRHEVVLGTMSSLFGISPTELLEEDVIEFSQASRWGRLSGDESSDSDEYVVYPGEDPSEISIENVHVVELPGTICNYIASEVGNVLPVEGPEIDVRISRIVRDIFDVYIDQGIVE